MTTQNQNQETKPLMPKGTYPMKCIAAKLGNANTGTDQIGMRLEIVDGPHKGETMLAYRFFTPATEERTIGEMRALGWQGVDMMDLSSMWKSGKVASVVVEHEPDQDNVLRAKVAWINGADVTMKNEMDGAALAAFAKRMRGVAARVGGAQTETKASMPPVNGRSSGRRDDADEPPPFDPDARSGGYRR